MREVSHGSGAFIQSSAKSTWRNLVRVEDLQMVMSMVIVFFLLEVNANFGLMGVGSENTCTVFGKWSVSMVVSRPYGWVNKFFKIIPIITSTAGSCLGSSQSTGSQRGYNWEYRNRGWGRAVWILWVANFRFAIYEICVRRARWRNVVHVECL